MRRRRKLRFSLMILPLAMLLAELGSKAWLRWWASPESFQQYASISQLRERYGAFDRLQAHRHLGYALWPVTREGSAGKAARLTATSTAT